MFLPPGLSYAIQALVHLTEDGELMRVRELADKAHVPQAFLAKLLQRLARFHVVEGHRGPTGGYRLARSASRITIRDLAQVLETDLGLPECILANRPCGVNPCAMHEVWARLRPALEENLMGLSIGDLQRGHLPPWVAIAHPAVLRPGGP